MVHIPRLRPGRAARRLWRCTGPARTWVMYYVRGFSRRTDEIPVFVLAGGLAFALLLCAVPLVLIAFFVLGRVLAFTSVQHQVDLAVRTMVPYEPHAEFLTGILFSRAQELVEHRNVYGIVGGIGLLVAASGLFGTMRTILNQVFQVQRRRGAIVSRLLDAATVFVVLCFVLVAVAAGPFVEALRNTAAANRWLQELRLGAAVHLLYSLLSGGLLFLAFLVLYFLLPDQRPGKRAALIGALWAAALWEVAAYGFGYYLSHFATMRRVYGAYALVVALATWIYYASAVFVGAAVLGQLSQERRDGRRAGGGSAPGSSAGEGGGIAGKRP